MMKKVLFSLLLAFVCLPMAIGQTNETNIHELDTSVCGSFTWIDNVTYTTDTVVLYMTGGEYYLLTLDVREGADSTNTTVTACGSYTAPWGEVLTESFNGTVDTVINGCVRHDVLNLTIKEVYEQPLEVVTAECVYLWHGHQITDTQVHHDTLTAANQCDSIISLQVSSFSNQETIDTTMAACGFLVAPWGDTLTTSGLHTNVATVGNCTTTTNINLTINNVLTDTAAVVVSDVVGGCSYSWNGLTITDNNTHYKLLTSAAGCDSLAGVHVTSYTNKDYDTSFVNYCGDAYTWHGLSFTNPHPEFAENPDTYEASANDTVINSQCTTYHHLSLVFVQNYDTVTRRACEDYTYTFDGRDGNPLNKDNAYYNQTGLYTHDSNGVALYSKHYSTHCITHHALNLTIVDPESHERPDTIVVNTCDRYTFKMNMRDADSASFTSDTLYTRIRKYRNLSEGSCYDTIIHLDITIRHSTIDTTVVTQCDTFTWAFNGEFYTHSGNFRKKIADTVNAQGCDSIGLLNLTINKTPEVTITGNWVLEPNETATLKAVCADNSVHYDWYKNGVIMSENHDKDSISITPNGEENIDIHLTTTKNFSGGNKCTANNWITITTNVGIDNVENMLVNIYPNPTSRMLNLQSADGISEVVIYNTVGQQVMLRKGSSDLMQLDLGNLATGSYTLRITAANGEQATRKINVIK